MVAEPVQGLPVNLLVGQDRVGPQDHLIRDRPRAAWAVGHRVHHRAHHRAVVEVRLSPLPPVGAVMAFARVSLQIHGIAYGFASYGI